MLVKQKSMETFVAGLGKFDFKPVSFKLCGTFVRNNVLSFNNSSSSLPLDFNVGFVTQRQHQRRALRQIKVLVKIIK